MTINHSPTKECQKRGTATEHAMQPQRGTATEHAERRTPGARGILNPNAQTLQAMEDAQADRADNTTENLSFQLADFLSTMLRDVWNAPGFRHATEQAKSSADHSEKFTTARGHAVADSTATEHAELSASFRSLVEDIFDKRIY